MNLSIRIHRVDPHRFDWARTIACAAAYAALASALLVSFGQTALSLLGHAVWEWPMGSILVTASLLLWALSPAAARRAYLWLALSFLTTFVYNWLLSITRMGLMPEVAFSFAQIATTLLVTGLRIASLRGLRAALPGRSTAIQTRLAACSIAASTLLFLSPVPVAFLVSVATAYRLEPALMTAVRCGNLAQCLHFLQLSLLMLTCLILHLRAPRTSRATRFSS